MALKNSINLLKKISGVKNHDIAVFFTYTFDPVFFDNSIFKLLKKNNPNIIVIVFVDYSTYLKNSDEFTDISGKEYLLLPVKVGSVFHPKVFYFHGKENSFSIVGSHNLTLPGITHNMEIASLVEDQAINFTILTFVKRMLENLIKDEENFIIQKINEILEEHESIKQADIYFLSNWEEPILNQIIEKIKDKNIKKLNIICPFFSKTDEILQKINDELGIKDFTFTLQLKNHNLNVKELKKFRNIKYQEIETDESRRLHFKLLYFEGNDQNFIVVGSPNFTKSALLNNVKNGNLETCLLIKADDEINKTLFAMKTKSVGKNDIESTYNELKFKKSDKIFENIIYFCYLDRITDRIILHSNAEIELKLMGKLFDGSIIKFNFEKTENGIYKIPIIDKKYPLELWFTDGVKQLSNKSRIFYRLSEFDMLPQYRNKPKELNKLVGKISDITSMVRVLYTLFGNNEEKKPKGNYEKEGREISPSLGKLTSKHGDYDIFSFIQNLLRETRKNSLDSSYGSSPKPDEDEPPEPKEPIEHDQDILKEIDKIFDKITSNFSNKILAFDNRLSRYIQYVLICLWFEKYFEKEFQLRTDRYYAKIVRNLNNQMSAYSLSEDYSEEEFFDYLFLLITVRIKIKDNKIRNLTIIDSAINPFKNRIYELFYQLLENPCKAEKLSINSELYGFTKISIEKFKNEFLPEILSICIDNFEIDLKEKYIRKIINEFFDEDNDPIVLIYTKVIINISEKADFNMKNIVREVIKNRQKSVSKRFKETCLEDIKKAYNF